MLDWFTGRRTDGATRREALVSAIFGGILAASIFAFFVPGGILEHIARAQGWI